MASSQSADQFFSPPARGASRRSQKYGVRCSAKHCGISGHVCALKFNLDIDLGAVRSKILFIAFSNQRFPPRGGSAQLPKASWGFTQKPTNGSG